MWESTNKVLPPKKLQPKILVKEKMDSCSTPDAWYNHLQGAILMIMAVSIITTLANKVNRGNTTFVLATGGSIMWSLYYASYYGRKKKSFPCYHIRTHDGWIPEITSHQTFYAHAHPILYAVAIGTGLALGHLFHTYNIQIRYSKYVPKVKPVTARPVPPVTESLVLPVDKPKDVGQIMEDILTKS